MTVLNAIWECRELVIIVAGMAWLGAACRRDLCDETEEHLYDDRRISEEDMPL